MPRKRKTCKSCTRAKAKCSPSEHGPPCHRCHRLNKECVFSEENMKKPGPKSRSRVKQLEQRVESLIDLIKANNSSAKNSVAITVSEENVQSQVSTPSPSILHDSTSAGTPEDRPASDQTGTPAFKAYDPLEADVIDENHACRLLDEFKTSFISSFPFIVVEQDLPTLRRQQPFLFHSIMAVMSYETPRIQCLLAEELRRQIAYIIEHSRKSLEIVQGLLVYAAWYHSFYHPLNQQLAVVVQLCVALVQDLGLSSNHHKKNIGPATLMESGKPTNTEEALAGKRAFLGTYFVTVTYAQAWRKRSTLHYTRFMAQCCESFAGSSVLTDMLIAPFIQLCELCSRVNDHFSYDDVENSEVHGELLLEMSVGSFRNELMHIRESVSKSSFTKNNATMDLMLCLLNIWIHECCLHSSLWRSSTQHSTPTPSLIRLKMLNRTMDATTSYVKGMLQLPQALHNQLGLQSRAGWFYAVIVTYKLVFLEDNERLGHTQFDALTQELNGLLPQDLDNRGPHSGNARTHDTTEHSSWEPLSVAQKYNIQDLFNRFMNKLSFARLPPGCPPLSLARGKRGLHAIACVQHTMLHGFIKRIERLAPSTVTDGVAVIGYNEPGRSDVATAVLPRLNTSSTSHVPCFSPNDQSTHPAVQSSLPFVDVMDYEPLNFDGVALPANSPTQQNGLDDWIWDTIMDDFTMPSL